MMRSASLIWTGDPTRQKIVYLHYLHLVYLFSKVNIHVALYKSPIEELAAMRSAADRPRRGLSVAPAFHSRVSRTNLCRAVDQTHFSYSAAFPGKRSSTHVPP